MRKLHNLLHYMVDEALIVSYKVTNCQLDIELNDGENVSYMKSAQGVESAYKFLMGIYLDMEN